MTAGRINATLTERRYSKRMNRILVIRGGAIGDFILTLPALKALREGLPYAHIEILGYKHIAVLAQNRFYTQAIRSIEYGALASFFAKNSKLPAELANHFASFDLIISYLYDPDGIFEKNLRRCGVENLIHGPAKLDDREHAARQLARPLEELGLRASDFAPRIYHSTESRKFAEDFLRGMSRPILAIHPGSGSETKNWPIENWIEFGSRSGAFQSATGEFGRLGKRSSLIVSGEADEDPVRAPGERMERSRCAFRKKFTAASSGCRARRLDLCRTRQRNLSPCRGCGRKMHFAIWSDRSGHLGADE